MLHVSVTADSCTPAGGPPDKEAQLLESWKAYKTGFQQGIALFNKKPKKGIAFMVEQVRSLSRECVPGASRGDGP